MAERGRTRAFADLLVERQTGQQDSDPYSPVTVDQVLETVNGQRGLVLYFSLAAGYLYSWLLAPGTGRVGGWEHTPPARGPCCSRPPAPPVAESAASSVPPGWVGECVSLIIFCSLGCFVWQHLLLWEACWDSAYGVSLQSACSLLLGILKFHECYLGEGPAGHSGDLQDRSSGLHTLASSALEQLGSSVREALGVGPHFVRQVPIPAGARGAGVGFLSQMDSTCPPPT